MNKPDSGRWPLVDLQDTRAHPRCPEHGQQVAAALAPHTMTAIVLQHFRVCWKELNTDYKGGVVTYIPYQFIPTPLLYHVTRSCRKKCLQRGYTREEVFDLVSDRDGFLRIGSSK